MAQVSTAAIGARASIAIGQETRQGVPVTPDYRISFTTESLTHNENTQESEEIRNDRARERVYRTTVDVSGDIATYIKASGHGMLYYNALGEYVRLQRVDGSIRGRQARLTLSLTSGNMDISTSTTANQDNTDNQVVQFTRESTVPFDDNPGGKVALVYRNALEELVADDNTAAGYDYLGSAVNAEVIVTAVNNAFDDNGVTVVELDVSPVWNAAGNLQNPAFDDNGGIITWGDGKYAIYYHAEAKPLSGGNPDGLKLYLFWDNDGNGDPNTATSYPGLDEIIQIESTMSFADTFAPPAASDSLGTFYMQHQDTGWDDVWTHHIVAGATLPAGMTIDVDRDAVCFVFTGQQVSSATWTFEPTAIANSTWTFAGIDQFDTTYLEAAVKVGATSVTVNKALAVAFADPADTGLDYHVISIDGRTDIRYNTYTDNGDTITLGGIPASGDGSIDRFYKAGTQVDSRTSIRETDDLINESTSAFIVKEIFTYQLGQYEECLMAAITLDNGLNTDKHFLGSETRAATVAMSRSVSGTVRYEFDDGRHIHRYKQEILFPLEIRCVAGKEDAFIIGSEPIVAKSMSILLPSIRYNGGMPSTQGKDTYYEFDMNFDAFPDLVYGNRDIIMTFVNDVEKDVSTA